MRQYDYCDVFHIFTNYYNNKLGEIPEPGRAVVVVISTKGVIDNGGFEFFMESDFPDGTPHGNMAESYRLLGINKAAEVIDEACRIVGDVVGLPYEHRKVRSDNNAKRLGELDAVFFALSNEINDAIKLSSHNFCVSFNSSYYNKMSLLVIRLFNKFKVT